LKINLSGFTNIYTLFLLKSIYQLNKNGRAAYIIPSEFLNSDYGKYIKEYLLTSDTLRHIITFGFRQNIFDDALTTSAIILLAKDKNDKQVCLSVADSIGKLNGIATIINNYPNAIGKNAIDKKNSESQYQMESILPETTKSGV